MNLPDVSAWLASGQDFAHGVALYAALGTSTTYQRLFTLGESDYSQQVLVRELSALVATPAPESAPAPVVVQAKQALESVVAPVPELRADVEGPLADLRAQLKAARDERSHTHAQLTAPNLGRKARLKHALRIVELTAQEVKLKALEAHVRQHGRLPGPVATAEVSDEAELRRRLLNLRSQRTKLSKQPARADDLAQVKADIVLILSKLKP